MADHLGRTLQPPPDWSEWWWAAAGNGVGGVLAIAALGAFALVAVRTAPLFDALATFWAKTPRLHQLMILPGAFAGVYVIAQQGLHFDTRGAAVFSTQILIIVVFGIMTLSARRLASFLARFEQSRSHRHTCCCSCHKPEPTS